MDLVLLNHGGSLKRLSAQRNFYFQKPTAFWAYSGEVMNRDIPIQFTPEYDAYIKRAEAKLRGNISSVKMTEEETAKEIEKSSEGVFIHPIPVIEPTGPELDLIAVTILKKKRGRPKGSRNKQKVTNGA